MPSWRTRRLRADKPMLSTHTRRAASIMAMWFRLLLVSLLSVAALACPVLCADAPAPHDDSGAPCAPDGHRKPCDNSCFCSSSATAQQASWRSLLAAGFTFAACVNAAECDLVPVLGTAPVLLAAMIQPASWVERALPLLI